jgi:glycolate oxidase FAD binding subunit
VRDAAAAVGGHATAFRTRDKSAGVFAPLPPPLRAIHERLKRSFDPKGILNRGRLYRDL